mgnify:FL=1|jgi:DNA repair photolyase
MIDTGFLYAEDNHRIFINSCLGCTGGCKYCYLAKSGYDNNSKLKVKKAEEILSELNKSGLEISEKTLITLGCFSECWDDENKSETIKLIKYFLQKGNQVQLSTKKEISTNEMADIPNFIKYYGQLVVFLSSATISKHSSVEPNTDEPQKRFRTFRLKKELGIPTVLYIKPVLQGITINDVEEYKEVIRNYGIQDVVVGSLFTEQQNSETVHFSNENKLFYNPVSDEEVIKRQLSECARVYTRSSQVMQQYREKELSER